MKPATKARQALLATLIAGTTLASTGCSSGGFSLASMNPLAQAAPSAAPVQVGTSFASTTDGAKSQLSAVGASAKSALGKTTSAITGVFSRNDEPQLDENSTDPLSLSNKPKNVGAEVYVANGQLWESTGDFGKAMESYTKALENEANNAPALTSIARLHFRQGNHKLAADFFRRAIAQNPDDAGLRNDLGLTLSKLGDHAGATQSLQKALEIAPGTSRYANNLASVKFEAGESSSAYEVLSKNNKPAVAHFNMAYLHFKNGQMNEAKGHLNQALQSQPQAGSDAAVQRAVERSRDMLAQIDASMAPVAQAAPQATIAGGQFFAGAPKTAPVQQTSQSAAVPSKVAPAVPMKAPIRASMTPAMAAIQPPASTQVAAPKPAPSAASQNSAKQDAQPSAPLWGTSQATKESRPMPVKPSAETSAAPTAESSSPSIPFALPGGFAPGK